MKIDEENYVELMQRGNEEALWYFIENHGWIVKSIICKMMAAFKEEQEDCMNDVFLTIWENAGKYDCNRAAFSTWVAAVTKYRIHNYLRNHQKEQRIENCEIMELIGQEDVQTDIYRSEEKEEFRRKLSGLSESDQEIFMKLYWDEMSHDEISRDTGIKKDVLYNRISRAKRKLRKMWRSV